MFLVFLDQDESKRTYWKTKNSWSSQWGENGYFRVHADYDCDGQFDAFIPFSNRNLR